MNFQSYCNLEAKGGRERVLLKGPGSEFMTLSSYENTKSVNENNEDLSFGRKTGLSVLPPSITNTVRFALSAMVITNEPNNSEPSPSHLKCEHQSSDTPAT